MRTIVLGPIPDEIDALIARRQAVGLDTHDEVWKGDYHLPPAARFSHGWLDDELAVLLRPLARDRGLVGSGAFNLGDPGDFRVPDRGLHRGRPSGIFLPTAAMVIEILSPHDETWDKLGFYAEHGVDEVLIVSGAEHKLTWLLLEEGRYVEADHSRLLGEESRELVAQIDWPPAEEDEDV